MPALWRKVEIISEDAVRVWAAGIDYIVGDEVAYPDENGTMYTVSRHIPPRPAGNRLPCPRCGLHRMRPAMMQSCRMIRLKKRKAALMGGFCYI